MSPLKKICPECKNLVDIDEPYCDKCNLIFVYVASNKHFDEFDLISELYDKASSFMENEEYEKAIEYYDKMLEVNNRNIVALRSKAYCYSFLDDNYSAILYFEKALNINSNSVPINNYLMALDVYATELLLIKKYNEAIEYYDKILLFDNEFENVIEKKNFCIECIENHYI